MPQLRGSCGHCKASWDSHISCLSCSLCSRSNTCNICCNWSSSTWSLADKRRTYKGRMAKVKQTKKTKKSTSFSQRARHTSGDSDVEVVSPPQSNLGDDVSSSGECHLDTNSSSRGLLNSGEDPPGWDGPRRFKNYDGLPTTKEPSGKYGHGSPGIKHARSPKSTGRQSSDRSPGTGYRSSDRPPGNGQPKSKSTVTRFRVTDHRVNSLWTADHWVTGYRFYGIRITGHEARSFEPSSGCRTSIFVHRTSAP